ncbi:MAG: hypothetical protein RJA57_1111 [Bacteroidota bacterium]|jgi:2-polyprenyl-3-methyl-5-hydroxy-6-metoxy-1,4-benzoquinol methylase
MNFREQAILASWEKNARRWIDLIQRRGIASRNLVTDSAIVEAVLSQKPHTMLDLGCGEGWLCRMMAGKDIQVTGADAIPELIEYARQSGPGRYVLAEYASIASGKVTFSHRFDVITLNFALLGKESTAQLLAALPQQLEPGGCLLIQTLHPGIRESEGESSGWKEGSWEGLQADFTDPYEWYFRTLEDWLHLIKEAGFSRVQATDYPHPETGAPLSVIFECRA